MRSKYIAEEMKKKMLESKEEKKENQPNFIHKNKRKAVSGGYRKKRPKRGAILKEKADASNQKGGRREKRGAKKKGPAGSTKSQIAEFVKDLHSKKSGDVSETIQSFMESHPTLEKKDIRPQTDLVEV